MSNLTLSDLFPSAYLKASDLDTPRVVIIDSVAMELMDEDTREQKPVVRFTDETAIVLNKTNGLMLASLAQSERVADWLGMKIELFREKVLYRGRPIDGIRVRKPSAATMPQHTPPSPQEPVAPATQPVALPAAAPLRTVARAQPDTAIVTPAQVRMLATVQRRAKVSDDAIHAYLHTQYGITSRKELKQDDLNDVLAWIEERGAIAALEGEAA
jgi:hypothetical protein